VQLDVQLALLQRFNLLRREVDRTGQLASRRLRDHEVTDRRATSAFGNAATRMASFVVKGGPYVYGSYPDIDELYQQQAGELDRSRREAILFKIQQLMVERTIYAPIWQLAFINGIGPRVGESGFGRIPLFPYTAPYEDITIKGT